MAKINYCLYCGERVDATKQAHVHSPRADEYRHLSCYSQKVMNMVTRGIRAGLEEHEEAKARQEMLDEYLDE